MEPKIVIRFPGDDDEAQRAQRMVEDVYRGHGYVECLKPFTGPMLLAMDELGEMHGAMGIFLHPEDHSGRFPTEDMFGIDLPACYEGADRSSLVEIGRLAGCDLVAAKGLFAAANRFLLGLSKTHTIVSMKPPLAQFMQRRLQLPIERVGGDVIIDNVPSIYRGYFQSDPAPSAYVMDLERTSPVIEGVLAPITWRVAIDLSGAKAFDHYSKLQLLP